MITSGLSRCALISAARAAILAIAALNIVPTAGCGNAGQTYSPIVKSGPAAPLADFTIKVAEATPGSGTAAAGATATYTVTLTAVNGFASAVTLSVSGLPVGAAGGFNPASVTPTTAGASSTLSITTTTAAAGPGNLVGTIRSAGVTPTGTYTISVTAAGAGLTHQATATLVVTKAVQPDFTILLAEATTGSGTVAQGLTAHYKLTVTSVGSFSTPVALSLTGLPAHAAVVFGTTTLTPTAAGAITTVDVTAGDLTSESPLSPVGTYALTATGTSGSLSHSSSANLEVTQQQTFTVVVTEATPGTGTVVQGGTAHYIVTVTSVRGYSAPTTLEILTILPKGSNFTFGTATLTPTPGGVSSTLDITTTNTTPTGTTGFVVHGSSPGNVDIFPFGQGTLIVTAG